MVGDVFDSRGVPLVCTEEQVDSLLSGVFGLPATHPGGSGVISCRVRYCRFQPASLVLPLRLIGTFPHIWKRSVVFTLNHHVRSHPEAWQLPNYLGQVLEVLVWEASREC